MAVVAINGFGRIGRATLKVLAELDGIRVAAINDVVPVDSLAYLLRYDSVYGRYQRSVSVDGDALVLDGRRIPVYSRYDPAELPWSEFGVDLVFECSGVFRREPELVGHLKAGAKFVLLSAPARTESVTTVVHGTNRAAQDQQIISCASCTTNCITPVMEILQRRIGVARAVMTTVHAYTASQQLIDGPSKDARRGRAGALNMVPASTGAALATTRALPDLTDRFDGVAVRVPIPVGSIADIVAVTTRPTNTDEINEIFCDEADSDRYRGIVGVAKDPIVSTDIVGDPRASVIDAAMTRVVDGTLIKIMAWYDNEWGFTNQMVRTALAVLGIDHKL
ncbi:type I glyceraldehyde-3-phosphate dehydrogenase [Mycobacterium branderi]|uniref:Glyceraldehyde-3-phosphate dehydrogenase n=1 Tax=Mycobacterium branderi TaxID=43348 RepID=A0A7I7W8I7_9MYCO|nr:type I glyceraldehyde-3-phosphate dehydrogenase [Mycobacterium branderi]MCV7231124.1 type I glyceraldehyde-3-phosphate dehydrogenase [Mycobacterium branderi]ORA35702.1 type I glyceraldehyde-3-phosphate dehydrogenase [Mycobacterium branderi]BBZ12743.1 glyceraldehyde-3-phosphate dehydrogenase [Mycobacterium branderi]